MLGILVPAWLVCLAAAGCASQSALSPGPTRPVPVAAGSGVDCGIEGNPPACATSGTLLVTPQLQEALHDLRRLGLVTDAQEVGHGRVALVLGDEGIKEERPLAYHLERLYRAYRNAYDLGDTVVLELWREGRKVGSYTYQGLLTR